MTTNLKKTEEWMWEKANELVDKLMPRDEFLFPSGTRKMYVSMTKDFIHSLAEEIHGRKKDKL